MSYSYREVGIRELPEQELASLQLAKESLHLNGPLVGGLTAEGKHPRGLTLHKGQTWLIRIDTLSTSASALALQFFKTFQKRYEGQCLFHMSGITLYSARRFYRENVFAEVQFGDAGERNRISSKQMRQVEELITILSTLHSHNLFHGNITEGNIFRSDTEIALTDHGIHFFSSSEAGKHADVLAAVAAGTKKDHENFLQLVKRQVPRLFSSDVENYIGTEKFFEACKHQIRKRRKKYEESSKASTSSSSSRREPAASRSGLGVLLFILCVLLGVFAYQNRDRALEIFRSLTQSSFADLRAEWLSGNAGQMTKVARAAAIDGDPIAQQVIVAAVQAGQTQSKLVLEKPLLFASNSNWYRELSTNDKTALFTFALAPLLREELTAVPDLSSVHSGVPLSLLAGLPAGKDPQRLFEIIAQSKNPLPSPYDKALKMFSSENASDQAKIIQSFLQLSSDDYSLESLRTYLPTDLPAQESVGRLDLLYPTLNEKDAEVIWKHLEKTSFGKKAHDWLESDSLVQWKGVSYLEKLAVLTGRSLPEKLTVPQLASLLGAPFITDDRFQLAKQLERNTGRKGFQPFFEVLLYDESLSRAQIVSLVSALDVTGEATFAFLEKWFETNPAPESVLKLLLATAEIGPFDAFDIEAARYLKRHGDWKANENELKVLANHPEPLARGLAYSRADLKIAAERSILEERLGIESATSLKKFLKEKLGKNSP